MICIRPNCTAESNKVLGGLCTGHYGVKRSKEIAEEKKKDKPTKENKPMKDVSEDLECSKCHKLATHLIKEADGKRSAFNFKQGKCRACVTYTGRADKKPVDSKDNKPKPVKTVKKKAPKINDEDVITIDIDFAGHLELMESIIETARKEFRTPEMQILKMLSESVEE